MADVLLPFVFEGADVRGAVVSLDTTWGEVLARHAYPPPVRALLGEAMAASALLASTLKFDGTLILQTQAEEREAPVRLMVVECNADLSLRATAKLGAQWQKTPEAINAPGGQNAGHAQPGRAAHDAPNPPSAQGKLDGPAASVFAEHTLASLVGDGKLVITLDPRAANTDRHGRRGTGTGQAAYQGVVPLEGTHLAAALENYMLRSEQLDTRIFLAADGTRAAGLLIQRLPGEGGHATPAAASKWADAGVLAATITAAELLSLAPREVMRRLFHEFDLRVFTERRATFKCTCSRERVAGMLRALGRDEVDDIVSEQGAVSVNCEFCNLAYNFDAVDAAHLFADPLAPLVAASVRH